MNRRKNRNYYKKLKENIPKKENNNSQNIIKKKYPYGYILFLIESIIKDIYYLLVIIVLKIYYDLKIDEISHRGYLLFLLLDTISNGGSIYYLIYSLIKLYDLYSPFNQEWSYVYIWVICSLQLLFLFTSIILFLMKYIYIKLFFISKFKILFTILCIVIILFNFSSLNDLNSDKYSFQIQNFEIKKLANYKEYFKRHYVNLYLSKEYDVDEYELCFEMGYPSNFSEILKQEPHYSLWKFEEKKDYFIGCRNISFKDNPTIDKENPLSFFKCDVNNKINILPNYCVSAEIRRKKFNLIYKLNVFEILILISFFIYGKLCNYIFYKYHLYNISKENYEELREKNSEGEEDEEEDDDEGGEYEEEEEEDDEEEQEEEEEIEKKTNWRRNKYRKISKKKKKYYKKKQKNRYIKYNYSNENKIKNNSTKDDEENNELINNEENNKNEKVEKIDNKITDDVNSIKENNEKYKYKKKEKYNDNNENNSDKNEEMNKNDKIKEIKKEVNDEEKKENIDNENNEDKKFLCDNKISYKRNSFLYHFFLGSIVDKIKNKFYNILKEIDKDIKEDEEN